MLFEIHPSGKETVLHSFSGADGSAPFGGLVRDENDNLYGTTRYGGSSSCQPFGCGVVFKLRPNGTLRVLHSFNGADGAGSEGSLIRSAIGHLYGTTYAGGAVGAGVVFELDPNGNETVLHSFGVTDGWGPYNGLVRDAAGNLYGTASNGGSGCGDMGCGLVFELSH